MSKKAFTLIELLVVVAIIGLLSTIVLVNVRGTKDRARDANIQSLMHQLRNTAEISYTKNNESYGEVCDEGDNTVSNSEEFGVIEEAVRRDNKNQPVTCYESSDKKNFAVSSPFIAQQGKHWCVESAGLSIELNNAITSAQCQ